MAKAHRSIPRQCHCGSGKLPGIMREHGWCCGECLNDFRRFPGSAQTVRSAIKATVRGIEG